MDDADRQTLLSFLGGAAGYAPASGLGRVGGVCGGGAMRRGRPRSGRRSKSLKHIRTRLPGSTLEEVSRADMHWDEIYRYPVGARGFLQTGT